MKVERGAILTCSTCGVEGPHELLYLSDRLCASHCDNCGATLLFSGHIYAEYTKDVAERTAHLPVKLVGDIFQRPAGVLTWPFKVLRKPLKLFREVAQITAFEQGHRRSWPSGRGSEDPTVPRGSS